MKIVAGMGKYEGGDNVWKVDVTELDLHLMINSADVQMKGEFCRSGGRIKVVTPLWIKVVDDYDYHQIAELTRERSFYYGTFTGLNDMAYYQSTMGVLTFYTNWIMFSETRIGKGAWK